MGNHDVGRGMAAAARTFWRAQGDRPVSKELALAALDDAAQDYVGADAEFDDELYGETPLTKLIAIAFEATPAELESRDRGDDNDDVAWYDGPATRFNQRYGFC